MTCGGVEAGGQVEDRAVGRGRDRQTFVDELGVLEDLAGDEERAHEVGDDEPASKALDVAALGRETRRAGR